MTAPPAVDFGRGTVTTRRHRLAMRFDVRTAVVCSLLGVLALLVLLISLATGDYQIPLPDVVSAIFNTQQIEHTIVVDWRLPRALSAVLFGAALGASGAIFQSLTRNPLGSPDVLGFATGSYTGALVVMLIVGGSYAQVATGALLGGIGTAAIVYVLAYRHGVQGFRLIIVGIAVAAMLQSANTWLILEADLDAAISAAVWGTGSLNNLGWPQALPALSALVILFPLVALLARPMRHLELGDDAAKALGLNAERVRLALVAVGVALTAVVTASAGPIAFIALAAPQIARRLTRAPGVAPLPAAFMGALLLVAADYVAQHVLPEALPVGIVTVCIGGTYLIWLLVHEARRRT